MHTIFYFSGTGNTWLMADHINAKLNEQGIESKCYSIETLTEEESNKLINDSEHLIIGYPIYGSEAPEPMKRFIENMPKLESEKTISVFCTQAFFSGDGGSYLEDTFKAKNYLLRQTREFNLSNNFYVPTFVRAFKVGGQNKINKRKEKAFKHSDEFIEAIIKEEQLIKTIGFFSGKFARLQRKEVHKHIKKVNDSFSVEESCIHCNLCVKLCPMENIYDKEGQITFEDNCAACMRCYQACPKSAILIMEASRNLDKYPRFKGPIEKFDFNTMKK